MIIAATTTQLTQRCDSCDSSRDILYSAIKAGLSVPTEFDGEGAPVAWVTHIDLVLLTACTCGAVETLNRTWVDVSRHGQGVNAVHAKLVELGYVNEHCADELAAEVEVPENVADLPWSME